MSQVEPTTKIDGPIPKIVRPGRPPKVLSAQNGNGHGEIKQHVVVPPLPEGLPAGKWSDQAVKVLEERYLLKDDQGNILETPDQMCWRVAWDIASAEVKYGYSYGEIIATAKNFYCLLSTHQFLPNSPTLMNAGKNNGLQYNGCFVIPVDDSIEGIFDGIKWTAIIHKSGGGTGFSFSRLRQSGARVGSTKGIASGPVSFMKIYDAATEQIKQGGARRGANMGTLRIDHPDILQFIHCKENGGVTNFNISVTATDTFMKAYKEGTTYDLIDPKTKKAVGVLDARQVMDEIADGAWKTGDPGMIFIDQVNSSTANPVPLLGPIETTNPCVTGDTLISTREGLVRMDEVVNSHFPGGKRAGGNMALIIDNRTLDRHSSGVTGGRAVKFFDNGIKDVFKLITKSSFELTATPEHKLLTPSGWVELNRLKPGDKIYVQGGEGEFNKEDLLPVKASVKSYPTKWTKELGQVLGWLVADGWLRTGDKNCRVGFTFGKEDKEHLRYFGRILNEWYGKEIKSVARVRNTDHLSYHGKDLVKFFLKLGVKPVKAESKEVPESIYTASKEAVVGFLQALFTADGTIATQDVNNTRYIRLTSKSKLLLKGVQLLLLNLGIFSRIYNRSRRPRFGMFPYNDVHGNRKTYTLDGVLYELQISQNQIPLFLDGIGFLGHSHEEKINKLKKYYHYYKTEYVDEIKSISPAGQQRVYDLTEENSYTFITNGIVSYDCGEQPLYPFDACNLGSIFLTYFVKDQNGEKSIDWEKLASVTKLSVRFLDNVIERNPIPLDKIQQTVNSIRRIGLGVGGWADLLVQLGIPYNSDEAASLAEKVMKFVNDKGHEASWELAKERGPFPLWSESIYRDSKPLRNSTVTTIAPTGSIGIIANASTGIEPFFAIAYKHYVKTNALERTLLFFNPLFEEYATGQLWYTDEVKEKIAAEGTLAHIEEIPDNVKKIFVTAHDIASEWHIKMQAAFQKSTDNAVSKTINLPNSATRDDIKNAYLQAYEGGCRGITVYRDGCKSVQVLNLGTKNKQLPVTSLPVYQSTNNNGHSNDRSELPMEIAQLRSRPHQLSGKTYRADTPVGHAYITINATDDGSPFEVFITVGHAGTDVAADVEAIGRLISMSLRIPSQLSPKEILLQIVDQLRGIGGSNHVGFGINKVRSLADAIAKVLEQHLKNQTQENRDESQEWRRELGDKNLNSSLPSPDSSPATRLSSPASHDNFQPSLPLTSKRDLCPTCGAATFIYEEGCSKCLACGYSKC